MAVFSWNNDETQLLQQQRGSVSKREVLHIEKGDLLDRVLLGAALWIRLFIALDKEEKHGPLPSRTDETFCLTRPLGVCASPGCFSYF